MQPQGSSFLSPVPRPSGLPLNSAMCPMPRPRQPLISNTGPSPSVTPAANLVVNARLRSPAPHLNAYRSSSSIPTATTTPTSLSLPQALTYSVLIQQQRERLQQQNLGNGLQGSNDVVCLSDDE
ncbi:unnamed protein product [Arabis nemorensis]|uniref:Uncharacterized protein n=1 Tax=Arabis nemorensis TaxID=586526 RepID=A0A565AN43_9BRAS|nr:unnamed protein product [Arabis nemorensis]